MVYQKILFCLMFLSFFVCSLVGAPLRKASDLTSPPTDDLSLNSIFSFGDSFSDTGNRNLMGLLGGPPMCGGFSYGKTLGASTGRCSDGYLMVDYIARGLGMPPLNPYLNRLANFSNGVNFAVAGSTALDTLALTRRGLFVPTVNIPLSVQLEWFRSHLQTLCSSTADCKEFLNNSLILMGEIGGNDYNYALMEGIKTEKLQALVLKVVRVIKAAVEEVINLGATKIVVPGNFPIGCFPIFLATFQSNDQNNYDEYNCLKDFNGFAQIHNYRLQKAIQELQQEHPDVAIVYADYYHSFLDTLEFADQLDFNVNDIQKACCGANGNKYNFDLRLMCSFGAPVCSNPKERFSWDGIHLTQYANEQLVENLIDTIKSLFYN